MEWLQQNMEWIFSGIGVAILMAIIGLKSVSNSKKSQKQSSGKNSINIQSGRDIHIGKNDD